MTIEYLVGDPTDDLVAKLEDVDGFGMFPSSLKIERDHLVFNYPGYSNDPSPYRAEYRSEDKTLTVYLDVTNPSMLAGGIVQEKIPIPEETRKILFETEGGDVLDLRTGKPIGELSDIELARHFLSGLKTGDD